MTATVSRVTARGQGDRVYAWLVLTLVVASVGLALFDCYVLVTLAAR